MNEQTELEMEGQVDDLLSQTELKPEPEVLPAREAEVIEAAQLPAAKEPERKQPAELRLEGDKLQATTFDEMWRLCNALANSNLVPKAYQNAPNDILIAFQAGAELGFGRIQSLTSIAVVHGKPTMSAQSMRAIIMASGICKKQKFTYNGSVSGRDLVCKFETVRKGSREILETVFEYDEAVQAGLVKNGSGWEKWPKDMVTARATARHCRLYYPDAIAGMYTTEEMRDVEHLDRMGPDKQIEAKSIDDINVDQDESQFQDVVLED